MATFIRTSQATVNLEHIWNAVSYDDGTFILIGKGATLKFPPSPEARELRRIFEQQLPVFDTAPANMPYQRSLAGYKAIKHQLFETLDALEAAMGETSDAEANGIEIMRRLIGGIYE